MIKIVVLNNDRSRTQFLRARKNSSTLATGLPLGSRVSRRLSQSPGVLRSALVIVIATQKRQPQRLPSFFENSADVQPKTTEPLCCSAVRLFASISSISRRVSALICQPNPGFFSSPSVLVTSATGTGRRRGWPKGLLAMCLPDLLVALMRNPLSGGPNFEARAPKTKNFSMLCGYTCTSPGLKRQKNRIIRNSGSSQL